MKGLRAAAAKVLHPAQAAEASKITRAAKAGGGATMQRKLAVYWASLLLALFAALILLASLLGFFSTDENNLHHSLEAHHASTVSAVNKHIGVLAAQSIDISEESSNVLDNMLLLSPISDLNNDASALRKAERALFPVLKTALESSPCNGAFLILDATVNTEAPQAESSRAGLLIRYANLNKSDAVNQDLVLYRGIFDVARENEVELHNRWHMEFDTSLIPWYKQILSHRTNRLADAYVMTERMQLPDTWEESVFLAVPIYGADGSSLGACGLEIGNLFFQLSYPAQTTEYGSMTTIIAPMEEGSLRLDCGIVGGLDKTYLSDTDSLYIKESGAFNVYSSKNGEYLGLHTKLDIQTVNGANLYAVTLIPREHFTAMANQHRIMAVAGSLVLLMGALALSFYFSKRFALPISNVLATIQAGSSPKGETTGISEIDTIVSILEAKASNLEKHSPPPDVISLLDEFACKFATLTATERRIVRLYAEDMDASSVAETMFISIHTVRKHNANIYKKMGVNSREELVLYFELFRRCGRLEDLFNNNYSLATDPCKKEQVGETCSEQAKEHCRRTPPRQKRTDLRRP